MMFKIIYDLTCGTTLCGTLYHIVVPFLIQLGVHTFVVPLLLPWKVSPRTGFRVSRTGFRLVEWVSP